MEGNPRVHTVSRIALLVIMTVSLQVGCAVHYYDKTTETEHLYGFGHMSMRLSTPAEGVRAAVTGTEIVGVGIGAGQRGFYLAGGWNRHARLEVIDETTSVRLEWPSGDLCTVKVGTCPPFLKGTAPSEVGNKEAEE